MQMIVLTVKLIMVGVLHDGLPWALCPCFVVIEEDEESQGPVREMFCWTATWCCRLCKEDFLWPDCVPLRSKAGCCLPCLEWLREQRTRCILGHFLSLTLTMSVDTPQDIREDIRAHLHCSH